MAPGRGFIVILFVALQPPTVYEIVAVPAVTPVTMPEEEPTVALVLLLLQVPPAVASVSVIVAPSQTEELPEIDGGVGFTVTVTVVVFVQPILVRPVIV